MQRRARPHPRSPARWARVAAIAAVMLGAPPTSGASGASTDEARDFLEFETVLDGRCHNLSEGGKLVQVRNRHPDRAIRYRFVRYFGTVAQGLSVGEIAPGDAAQKLGCNRVDGRPQRWEIERAQFVGD